MLNGPVKLIVGAAVVAALLGSVLSAKLTPGQSTAAAGKPAQPAAAGRGWFDGIEFSRGPVAAPPPQKQSGVQATPALQTSALNVSTGYGGVDLKADSGGQFHANVEIDGQHIAMLVDTGATLISLTSDDASRLGIRPSPADYTISVQTANGIAKAARVTLPEVRLGTLTVRKADAIVMPRDVKGASLLGMSFLQKVKFEIAGGALQLRQL